MFTEDLGALKTGTPFPFLGPVRSGDFAETAEAGKKVTAGAGWKKIGDMGFRVPGRFQDSRFGPADHNLISFSKKYALDGNPAAITNNKAAELIHRAKR
jgi:hypothetical protein